MTEYKINDQGNVLTVKEDTTELIYRPKTGEIHVWRNREVFLGNLSIRKDPPTCTVVKLEDGRPATGTGLSVAEVFQVIDFIAHNECPIPDGVIPGSIVLPNLPVGIQARNDMAISMKESLETELKEMESKLEDLKSSHLSLSHSYDLLLRSHEEKSAESETVLTELSNKARDLTASLEELEKLIEQAKATIATLDEAIQSKSTESANLTEAVNQASQELHDCKDLGAIRAESKRIKTECRQLIEQAEAQKLAIASEVLALEERKIKLEKEIASKNHDLQELSPTKG